MRKLVILIASATCAFLYSQDIKSAPQSVFGNNNAEYLLQINKSIENSLILNGEIKYEEIEGTPYSNKEFVGAQVSNLPKILLVRYNAFTDEIEVKMNDSYMALIKSQQLNRIEILNGGPVYELVENKAIEKTGKGYFIPVAQKGTTKLYQKERTKLINAKPAATTFEISKPAHFEKQKPAYYILNNGELISIPKDKKGLKQQFPNLGNSIESVFKSNSDLQNKEKLKQFLELL